MASEVILRPSNRCTVCKMIAEDPTLEAKIAGSTAFRKNGRTQGSIVDEYGFTWPTLKRHIVAHQNREGGTLNHVEMEKARVQKAARELIQKGEISKGTISTRYDFEGLWDDVIQEGRRLVNSGKLKLTQQSILKAAADKAAFQAKKTDTRLKVAEMMYSMASGGPADDEEDPSGGDQ